MKVLIIGAGVAGLSAAWRLQRENIAATVLEARDRIGGRVWTSHDFADIPVEFGAELIHGTTPEVNTWDWVRRLGLETWHWNKLGDSMIRLEDGRWMTMADARADSPEFDVTRSWELDDAPPPRDSDDLETYLRRIGFSDEQLRYVARSFANAEGESMRCLNAKAHAHLMHDDGPLEKSRGVELPPDASGGLRGVELPPDASGGLRGVELPPVASGGLRGVDPDASGGLRGVDPDASGGLRGVESDSSPGPKGVDHRILDGYDAYTSALADGLDIRLNTVVKAVDWSNGVAVTTASGETFSADRAIITLPLGVLQAGGIGFNPPLPQSKLDAVSGLRMGPVVKLVYRFSQPILDPSIGAIYARGNPPMWWSPSLGRESGDIVWTGFVTGDYARELHALGEEAALQAALDSLRRELNQPDLQPTHARWINWIDDPYSLGGYSVCLPGHYAARDKLAQPTPPLYWAGEASAPHHLTAMVHGAYFTGQRAAAEVIESL